MLTAKKKAFIEYYKADRNASSAARKAGYSVKASGTIGARLLNHDKDVQEAIKAWEQSEQEHIKEVRESLTPTKESYVQGVFRRERECVHPPTKAKYYEMAGRALGYLTDENKESVLSVLNIICDELRITLQGNPEEIMKQLEAKKAQVIDIAPRALEIESTDQAKEAS